MDILDFDDRLPGGNGEEPDEQHLLALLGRERGFQPGPIFVREFSTDGGEVAILLWGNYEDVISDPDSRSDGDDHEETCASLSGYWMRDGNFTILHGNDYIAGPDGVIHSS
jgi:hypothetical protein